MRRRGMGANVLGGELRDFPDATAGELAHAVLLFCVLSLVNHQIRCKLKPLILAINYEFGAMSVN